MSAKGSKQPGHGLGLGRGKCKRAGGKSSRLVPKMNMENDCSSPMDKLSSGGKYNSQAVEGDAFRSYTPNLHQLRLQAERLSQTLQNIESQIRTITADTSYLE